VEEMKNLDQMQQLVEKLLWFAHIAGLWTFDVHRKKQASMGLKKTINDTQ
jgi:hypothetical protein